MLGIIRHSNDQDERRLAVGSLRPDQVPEIIPELVKVLYQESNATVCGHIIWTLCRAFDERIEQTLREFLAGTEIDELRADSLSALLSHEVSDGRDLLLEELDRIQDENALQGLIRHLPMLGADAEFEVMARLVKTAKSASLRATVIDEMTHVVHPDATQLLLETLRSDPSAWVRSTAIATLYYEAWRNDLVIEAIIGALIDTEVSECPWSESWRVCDAAANCLQRLDRSDADAALAGWRSRNER